MADATAAFFAKKKKGKGKKKPKSFNANKIDVSSVTSTIHVDAPQVGTSSKTSLSVPGENATKISQLNPGEKRPNDDDEWAAQPTQKSVVVTQKNNAVTELLDMTALEAQRRGEDDIQERMRVQKTKRALAAARDGMAKEGTRLKEAEEQKDEKAKAKAKPVAAVIGGKWVPPHMRNTITPGRMSRVKIGNSVDTKDEEAFPDLGTANDLIEKQKQEELRQAEIKKKNDGKKPVWGAGSRGGGFYNSKAAAQDSKPAPNTNRAKGETEKNPKEKPVEPMKYAPVPRPVPPPAPVPAPVQVVKPTPPPAPATVAPTSDAPAPVKLVKKKKKKKDLSTFKKS